MRRSDKASEGEGDIDVNEVLGAVYRLAEVCDRQGWNLRSRTDPRSGEPEIRILSPPDPDPGMQFLLAIMSPVDRLIHAWAAEWYRSGAAVVMPPDAEVERVVALEPPSAALLNSIKPWAPFFLIVPGSAFQLSNREDQLETVNAILCAYLGGRWTYVVVADSVQYSTTCARVEHLRGDSDLPAHTGWETLPTTAAENQQRVRIGRLVLWAGYARVLE